MNVKCRPRRLWPLEFTTCQKELMELTDVWIGSLKKLEAAGPSAKMEDFRIINRFQVIGRPFNYMWSYTSGHPDAIRFRCNRDILVGGVGLYGGGHRLYKANVKIFHLGPDDVDCEDCDDGDCDCDDCNGQLLVDVGGKEYHCADRETHLINFLLSTRLSTVLVSLC